jgi:hypothetical protein
MIIGKGIVIPNNCRNIPKRHWIEFTRFIQKHADFYQLLAISAFVEARLHQIKPARVTLSQRINRPYR